MKTKYEQIVDVTQIGRHGAIDMNAIFALAAQEQLPAAINDFPRRLFLGIDNQNDFMEGGALGVPGSVADVERVTRCIYNNMHGITCIMNSLDTHIAQQIFHPCWWMNAAGDNPAPYTIITYDDVVQNRWRPVIGDPLRSLQYLKELEKAGKQLCIWPYHTINGTPGFNLENQYAKMVYFHSMARKSFNPIINKGSDPYSEMYGIIKPEFSQDNYLNISVLNAIEEFDEIYAYGEAASHCLKASIIQIAEHFANRPDILKRITILEDCTSPIPGYEDETKEAFEYLNSTYGIKFAKSTDIKF